MNEKWRTLTDIKLLLKRLIRIKLKNKNKELWTHNATLLSFEVIKQRPNACNGDDIDENWRSLTQKQNESGIFSGLTTLLYFCVYVTW